MNESKIESVYNLMLTTREKSDQSVLAKNKNCIHQNDNKNNGSISVAAGIINQKNIRLLKCANGNNDDDNSNDSNILSSQSRRMNFDI